MIHDGSCLSSQTTAIVTPALKKHGLDPTDMKNFLTDLKPLVHVKDRRENRCAAGSHNILMRMVFSRNFSLDLEDIILRNLPCFVCCPTFSPQSTVDGSHYSPSSTSVLHSTRSIMLSYSIDYLFRSGSRDQHSTRCALSSWVGHKQFTTVGPSRSVLLCVPEWLKDRSLDLSSTSSTPPTSRSWSNRSGSVSICTRMIRSSMGLARYRRRLVWLAVPCESPTRSKTGCRQTVFGWMLIRPSSFGWAQVTSSEIATRGRSTQSCRPPILWTISESTLTQNWLWSVRLANFVKFAISTCVTYAQCVDRSRRNAYARWFMLSSLVKWIIATASFTDRIHIFSTDFSPCWICCSPGPEHSKVQRNLGCHSWRATLATNQKAHRVQNCSSGATLPRRRCARVLDWTVSSCQFCRQSAKPPVCFQRRPHHSSFPTPNIWIPSFCYLGSSALELTPIGR